MRITTQIKGGTDFSHRLRELQEKVSRRASVYVGVPSGSGAYEDGTQLVVIAAANEFGADINHPGGTSYGYKTQQDAVDGNVQFLRTGEGFMELGKTDPHKIKIPERSFLRVPLRAGQKMISKVFRNLMPKVLDGEITMHQMLTSVGAKGAAISQEAISKGIDPPNAPSTIAKKGSSKPLVGEHGRLKQAITYVVEGDK